MWPQSAALESENFEVQSPFSVDLYRYPGYNWIIRCPTYCFPGTSKAATDQDFMYKTCQCPQQEIQPTNPEPWVSKFTDNAYFGVQAGTSNIRGGELL